MTDIVELLIPIAICVILPVMIVWLVMRARQNETNKKTEIMLKAIESGATIDADIFKTESRQKPKTIKEKLLGRLTGALVTGLLGVALLIVGIAAGAKTGWDMNEDLMALIISGGILFAIGIALYVVYSVGKKMLAKEMEAEEKALER